MRLKSIKLAGFKSFVDPTKVNLPGNLCAVVGPNGCGKSNIIDAVRWVMGESSAKNLRGENATDVIFNGSSSRQPVGQASIELTFDNHDRTLAGEFASYNDVSIRRKVTREGVSTYYLNSQKCRRRDVTDLFLGTGLGPRSYSIIEQGMISRLIESRPEELRVYIEEAAGISRYKERRRDTSNRINRTRENLQRLDDIREELGRQLETLKRQATSAEQYTQLKQSERQHKSQLAALQWRDLTAKLLDQRIGMGRIQDDINLKRSEQDRRLAQVDVQKTELAALNENFSITQGDFYRLGADVARVEQTIEHQRQQRVQWQADLDAAQENLLAIDNAFEADSTELKHLNQQQDQLAPDTELAAELLLAAQEVLQQEEEHSQAWQLQWQQKSDLQARLQGAIDVANTTLSHQQNQRLQMQQSIAKDTDELAQLKMPADTELAALKAQYDLSVANQEAAIEAVAEVEIQVQEGRVHEREEVACHDLQVHEISVIAAQLASLNLLLEDAQGNAEQLPDLWSQDPAINLIDVLSVKDGWQLAVEHVLEHWLDSYLIDDMSRLLNPKDVANRSEYEGQKNGLSVLHGGYVDAVDVATDDAVLNHEALLDKATLPAHLGVNLAVIFGPVYVSEDLASAQVLLRQLPPLSSVILATGLWIGHGWVRTPPRKTGSTGVLVRKTQIEALTKEHHMLEQALQESAQNIAISRTNISALEQACNSRREQLQKTQKLTQNLGQELALMTQRTEQVVEQKQRLSGRLEQKIGLSNELESTIEDSQENHAEQELALEDARLDIPNLLQAKEGIEAALNQAKVAFGQHQQQVIQLQARMDSVTAQISSLSRSVTRLGEQRAQWLEKRTEVELLCVGEGVDANVSEQGSLEQQLDKLLQQRVVAEESMEQQREAMSLIENTVKELELQQLSQEHVLGQQHVLLQDQKLIEREIEVNASAIKEAMREQNILIEKLAEILPEDANQMQLKDLLEQGQARIKRLGAINLMAIEEYKQQLERKDFLDIQYDELIEALNSLEQAINKIDKETRARFKETFDTVNDSLKTLFPKVFGGGRASLELTGDDMLATGVTIMAQPPGKRNSSIHLLSGGEKALTAIALVFSIFQLNPSPFCMLDEVDAPLDDANVERYARLVKEMSAQVQFIYISHNKIAMEMATQLLGVTMQESGVSRVVTVDVEQAISMTEPV